MELKEKDIVTLKKYHPCGSNQWELLYVASDVKIRCLGCDHRLMIPRRTLEKSIKNIESK